MYPIAYRLLWRCSYFSPNISREVRYWQTTESVFVSGFIPDRWLQEVGIRKLAYDIWGDTVNVASRMESSGEAGKVNISGTSFERVKNTVECVSRGKIAAKNKGMTDMYFVNQLRVGDVLSRSECFNNL